MWKIKNNLFLSLLSLFLFLPVFASADTVINSPITTDTTWTPSGGVYVIDSSFRVEPGVTLTIAPGTIIKGRVTSQSVPSIYGNLKALGTAQDPIYFTGFYDDTVGGDTDLSGPSTDGPGSWQGIYLKSGAVVEFDYVNFKNAGYGGFNYGNFVGIENDGGTLNINHSNLIDNHMLRFDWSIGQYRVGFAVRNVAGSLNIQNSLIASSSHGINIESGTANISNNQIKNNSDKGLIGAGEGTLILTNNTFIGNTRTASIDMGKTFIHSGNTSSDIFDRGYDMGGTINQNVTIGSEDLPIIIKGGITVNTGQTLTILPGTVMKIGGNGPGAININGDLVAEGTEEKPIYFTSTKDDTLFGDTNGDGANTLPAPRDWNAMYFENGSNVIFDHVVVRYGGYNYNGEYLPGVWTAIYDRGADFDITNSLFEKNYGSSIYKDAGTLDIERSEFIGTGQGDYGIFSRGGTINVHNSSFHGHLSDAILNQSGMDVGYWYPARPFELIDARNNWWGAPDGPRNIATTTPSGSGDPIGLHVLYTPFLTSDPLLEPEGPDPVIIIPGIVGSELYNEEDLIWPDLLEMAKDLNDQFITENLNLNEQGNSIKPIIVSDAIKRILNVPVLNVNIFEDLETELKENNYKNDQSLFFFPYDWRLDLDDTKELLKEKIEAVKAETGKEKVNIVAHSMGGLLTKAYIEAYGEGSIDKLIFVGTPHLGAPKAGKVLLEGDRFSIPWLEEDRIKELAKNSPALHQLLPNETYFNTFQGYLKQYELFGDTGLKNYADTNSYFINQRSANPTMFGLAQNFDAKELEDFSPTTIDTYNITGCKTSTQAAYSFAPAQTEISQVGYTSGDGTVPMISADYLNIGSSNKYYVKGANHAELPSTDGVRELILKILSGSDASLENNVSNSSDFCNFKGTKLSWHSPVEVHIYHDASGKHTGPTVDNTIEYGIPNIDYVVSGHNKFVFLPNDNGEVYRVEVVGLETGSFDLNITVVDNGQNLETKIFNDIKVDTETVAKFVVNDIPNQTIEIVENGVSHTETVDATLSGNQALDLVPPNTQIVLSGKEYKDGEFKKEVDVSFTTSDDNSGILETWYSLNNGSTYQKYTGKFTLGIEGVYNIKYYSIDRAGNNEEIKIVQVTIGKLSKYLRKLE